MNKEKKKSFLQTRQNGAPYLYHISLELQLELCAVFTITTFVEKWDCISGKATMEVDHWRFGAVLWLEPGYFIPQNKIASIRKLKVDHIWNFQQDNEPKYASKSTEKQLWNIKSMFYRDRLIHNPRQLFPTLQKDPQCRYSFQKRFHQTFKTSHSIIFFVPKQDVPKVSIDRRN